MLNAFLGMMPRSFRQCLVSSRVRIDEKSLARVRVKVATTVDETMGAARLVHDAYVGRGLMDPHPTGVRISPQAVLPSTIVLVAVVDEKVIGTLSLGLDSPLGLPMDSSFRSEMDALRQSSGRLAEISALAVAPEFRSTGVAYLLYRLMLRTAYRVGVGELTMTVHPRARAIYETGMLFEVFAGERTYKGLSSSAKAIALRLSPRGLQARFRAAFDHLGDQPGNPHYLHFRMDCPQIEELSAAEIFDKEDRVEAAEALARLRMDVLRELPDHQLAYLKKVLKGVFLPTANPSQSSQPVARASRTRVHVGPLSATT
jgi:GNAT superfamily N-acetyltransferase